MATSVEKGRRIDSSLAAVVSSLGAMGSRLSDAKYRRPLRGAVLGGLALWILVSVWRGLLSFVPEVQGKPQLSVINPVAATSGPSERRVIDIDALVAVDFFGTPGELLSPQELALVDGRTPAMSEEEAASALAGIEDGAPETRLPLVLRGVVASTAAGLGQAVIEYQQRQDLYRVSDELPVNGEVVLAKVLADRVVIENSGRYEIIRLFESTGLEDSLQVATTAASVKAPAAGTVIRSGGQSTEASDIAAQYRDQLYGNPESLADVVRISAVRRGNDLVGYRIAPGKAAREFTALGFKSGDIVTRVNGLALSDPSNTVRLYQEMRSAKAASFELTREGESVTLNVDIGRANSRESDAGR